MSKNKFPGKIGRYTGLGEPLTDVVVGRHDRGIEFMPWSFAHAFHYVTYYENGSYVAADYTQTLENVLGTIAMSVSGVLFSTASGNGNSCNDQLIRSTISASGMRMGCAFRASFQDVSNVGVVLGLHNTDSDYFSTEPTHQAVFLMEKGSGVFVGRTKDGSTGSSTSTLLTPVANELYDFSILYDGYNGAVFFGVKAASGSWASTDFTKKTTNLPNAAIRMSRNLENNEAAVNTMVIHKAVFFSEVNL